MATARRGAGTRIKRAVKTRILVVESRFYDHISDALLAGATAVLNEARAEFDVLTVPGSLEIPSAIAMALDAAQRKRKPYDGVVALGCVIRGETFHFEIVAGESARALMELSVSRQIPLGNGILTVDTVEQALARSNFQEGNKGADAAKAALKMIALKRGLAGR